MKVVILNLILLIILTKCMNGIPESSLEFYALASISNESVSSSSDSESPTLNSSTKITIASYGRSNIEIQWEKSTDNKTSQSNLLYSIFISESDNIDKVDKALQNGRLINVIKGESSYNITNLNSASTYYINIVVEDENNNKSIYTSNSKATTVSDYIRMYVYINDAGTFQPFTGNLGGREGADAYCKAAYSSSYSCKYQKAFLSISSEDEIADMKNTYYLPSDLSILGVKPTTSSLFPISSSWESVFDGSSGIDSTISAATGLTSGYRFWTGSDIYGKLSTSNCSGFQDSTASSNGQHGRTDYTTTTWKSFDDTTCNNSLYLLCVCF